MGNAITVGSRARFLGYSQLEEGFEPILAVDQLVEVTKNDATGIVVVAITDAGERLDIEGWVLVEGGKPLADAVWDTEIEILDAPVQVPTPLSDPTAFGKMKAPEIEDFAARNAVVVSATWAKMKLAEKRAFLAEWEAGAIAAAPATVEEVAVSPTAAVAAVAVAPLVRTFTDSESVRLAMANTDAITALKDLLKSEHRSHYTQGGLFVHIEETGLYKRLGYDGKKGFENFCKVEMDTQYRKVRYLMDIYIAFNRIGIDEARLDQIGWSKAKELARIGGGRLESDLDQLLTFAGEHTREELITHIQTNYETATRAATVLTTTFTFKLAESAADTARLALAHAATLTGEEDPNTNFAHMCGDWINAAQGSDLDLETFVAMGIARFGKEAFRSEIENTADETPETANA